jgi:hypothetical protein
MFAKKFSNLTESIFLCASEFGTKFKKWSRFMEYNDKKGKEYEV